MTLRLLAACTLVSAAIPSFAESQEPAWPKPRSAHAMVWHNGARQVVLLGGISAAEDSALWGWNGTEWRALATGGPAGRAHFGMAHDAARDRLVVHGGVAAVFGVNNPAKNGDTWEWDRRAWRRIANDGPGIRDHHAMVYDPVRKHVLMFGGADSAGTQMGDTWAWDGRAWTKLADSGPPGRSTHRLAFDSDRGVIVLFGGWTANGLLNDTWEWNGRAWTQITTAVAPPIRFAARMTYDAARKRTVLVAGRGNTGNFSDTWEFDGRAWMKIDAAGPSVRNVHEVVFDPASRTTLLFGGFNAPVTFSDLWSFANGAWRQLPRADARAPGNTYAAKGRHPVGYRVIDIWDRTRRAAPARDFEGRANARGSATPMQVSVWYPAKAGGTPMRVGDYRAIATKRETLGEPEESDVVAAGATLRGNAAFMLGIELPQRTADSIALMDAFASRDASPADGRFPLIVGGLEGPSSASGLAEYLASHGYVVVSTPSLPATATQQVNRAAVALETQTRNMEVIQGIALSLPFVDTTRIGLIGINFDGMAALAHQMRNMSASAVVSLDGYETKTSSAAPLRASPYFDASRMRVPYLSFAQDNPPSPALAFSDSLLRELKYAERYAYVVRDMEHSQLLGDLTIYPQLSAERRLGYDFTWRTIRSFLDGYVRGDSAGVSFLARSHVQNGYPAWLVKTERKVAAFAPIPTAEEVEQIVMAGDIDRLQSILRRARATDPGVRFVSVSSLNLFAFRFTQRGNREVAIALYELALDVIASDPDISPADKAASRTNIEQRIRQLRGR